MRSAPDSHRNNRWCQCDKGWRHNCREHHHHRRRKRIDDWWRQDHGRCDDKTERGTNGEPTPGPGAYTPAPVGCVPSPRMPPPPAGMSCRCPAKANSRMQRVDKAGPPIAMESSAHAARRTVPAAGGAVPCRGTAVPSWSMPCWIMPCSPTVPAAGRAVPGRGTVPSGSRPTAPGRRSSAGRTAAMAAAAVGLSQSRVRRQHRECRQRGDQPARPPAEGDGAVPVIGRTAI
jgi:hypothetical protein